MSFVKLDCGILDSSLWLEPPETRVVFLTMLAMTEPSGLCPATAPGISRRANLDLAAVTKALSILEAPDPHSRSLEDEGRRIQRVDGGYYIVNYLRYRLKVGSEERREQVRRAVARHRRKKCNQDVINGNQEKAKLSSSTSRSPSTSINKGGLQGGDEGFEIWWSRYPRKRGKGAALKAWVARIRDGSTQQELDEALTNYLEEIRILGTEERYVKHGSTFLGPSKPFEDFLAKDWKPPTARKEKSYGPLARMPAPEEYVKEAEEIAAQQAEVRRLKEAGRL